MPCNTTSHIINKNDIAATIHVEWGYEPHSLEVDHADWEAIKAGEEVTIVGEGYRYGGESFSDQWRFKGGIGGELIVLCGDNGGEGYIGPLTEDMIEVSES